MTSTLERVWPVAAIGRIAIPTNLVKDETRRLHEEHTPLGIASRIKHFDDQSVACFSAIHHAISSIRADAPLFRDWSVITMLRPKNRLKAVPQNNAPACGNSLGKLVCKTYGLNGPVFSVNAVHGSDSDAWAALMAFAATPPLLGSWLLLSEISRDDICRAIALAIQFGTMPGLADIAIRFGTTVGKSLTPRFSVESLDRVLTNPAFPRSFCRWSINGGMVEWRAAPSMMKRAA